MGTILKNILRFEGLAVGVPASLPHRLNVNGTSVVPKLGGADVAGFDVTADETNVTVTRTAAAGGNANVNIYVEYWHTIKDVTPLVPAPGKLTGLTPFFFATGGAGAALQFASGRVAFDGTTLAAHGCTISKTGQGQYHVDFTPPFPENVAVTAVLNQDSQNGSVIYVTNVMVDGFDVITRENTDGWLLEDLPWSFNALPAEAPVVL